MVIGGSDRVGWVRWKGGVDQIGWGGSDRVGWVRWMGGVGEMDGWGG